MCLAAVCWLAGCATQPPIIDEIAAPAEVVARSSAGNIEVVWSAVVGAEAYAVYRSVEGSEWTLVEVLEAQQAVRYRDWEVTVDRRYGYGIAARGGGAESVLATTESVQPLRGIEIAQQVDSTSDDAGVASIEFENYSIAVHVHERDGGEPIQGVSVHAIAMTDGVLVLASPGDLDFQPAVDFIRYSEFAPVEIGGVERQSVTATFLVLAIGAAVLAIHEFVTDPPYYEEVVGDDGLIRECLVMDINDALAVMSLVTLGTTASGYLVVKGAPAKLRGVTAIQMGFTKHHLNNEAAKLALIKSIDAVTDWLSKKHRVVCQLAVGNRITASTTWLPMLEIAIDDDDFTPPTQDRGEFRATVGTVNYRSSSDVTGTVLTYWYAGSDDTEDPGTGTLVVLGPEGWNQDAAFVYETTAYPGHVRWLSVPALTAVSGSYSLIFTAPDGRKYQSDAFMNASERVPQPSPISIAEATTEVVSATWPEVPQATHYSAYLRAPWDSGFTWRAATNTFMAGVTFDDLTLDPTVEYRFTVLAVTARYPDDLDRQVNMGHAMTWLTPSAVSPGAFQTGSVAVDGDELTPGVPVSLWAPR